MTEWRWTAQSSSSVTTGTTGVARDRRKAEESEWRRRDGLGLTGGLVLCEGSGSEVLSDGVIGVGLDLGSGKMTGRGICRDSLLVRVRREVELDLGCNFQPSGSGPVMTDVCTGGGEEQDGVVEDEQEEEEQEDDRLGEGKIPMGGHE